MHSQKMEHELENLIREVRVAMPGVQILFAFLLTVPFNQRFVQLDRTGLTFFLIAITATTCASFLFIAPTVYHRLHPRRGGDSLEAMLNLFNGLAIAGSAFLALAIVAALGCLAQFLFGWGATVGVVTVATLIALSLWYLLPWLRNRHERKFHLPTPPRGRRAHEPFAEFAAHR